MPDRANDARLLPPTGAALRYMLDEKQYDGPRSDSPAGFPTTVADRPPATSSGWRREERGSSRVLPAELAEGGERPGDRALPARPALTNVYTRRRVAVRRGTQPPRTSGADQGQR